MNTAIAAVAPATDWAWDRVSARHLNFDPETSPTALVLLAFARLADEALNSPNGYDHSSLADVAGLLRLSARLVLDAADNLKAASLLTWTGKGYRIPEAAFNV